MRITADVELPETLLEAQESRRLVVFAGAGISIDAPSGMPSFPGLLEALAAEAGVDAPDWDSIPPDVFLGRLKNDGFPLHDRVASILTPNLSQTPNPYHGALVRLFREPDVVRMVTTNHDPFLTLAAADVFGGDIESFYAPALPVGDEFSGIVYLHGGIARDPARLVLTDRDFGRAYLTQGWATTFLRGMYSAFDVLFVGYRHGEPVLRYLAIGLSATSRRYAFDTADADSDLWRSIGVEKVPYPRAASPSEHTALGAALEAWSERTRLGYLEHRERLKGVLAGLPPLELEVADYIRQTLSDAATARFFADDAVEPEWLEWVKSVPEFRALFGTSTVSPASQELATWFATRMMLPHPDAALSVYQELGGRVRPELWFACAHRLWTADPRPRPDILAKWTTALLESVPDGGDTYIGYILGVCRWPEDRSLAILLFAYLTDPRPIFEERILSLGEGPGVRISVSTKGDPGQLSDSWASYFMPRISELFDQIEPIVAGQLVRAHEILKSTGEATDRWDPNSFLLPRVEDQDEADA